LEGAIKLVKKKQEEKRSIQSSVSSTVHNEKVVSEASEFSEPEKSMLHALVIDDSSAIRKQLELELRVSKVAADFAESGEQALEKVKQRQFDLIFLDIMMPGIDGYETCKLIRANAEYKKTPIIMLSGKTSPLDEVQGIIAGATTYLTKPVKSANFQKVLSRVTAWVDNFKEEEQKKKQLLNKVT
jgi:CheY-like chemotaxis protein